MIFILVFFHSAKAQETFAITYEGTNGYNFVNKTNPSWKYVIKAFFNDSLYYSYIYETQGYKARKSYKYGKKITQHAQWYNPLSSEMFYGVALSNKNAYLVRYKQQIFNWIIDTVTTHFFDSYRCKKAYVIIEPGDTSFVVYTTDIPYAYGNTVYLGLPGAVLEYYNTKTDSYIRAIKVEKGKFFISMPDNPKIQNSAD